MDEVVTHDEVLRWLPTDVQREWKTAQQEREMAMPPEQRGWYTREEAERGGGRFVEVQKLSERYPRLLRTGD